LYIFVIFFILPHPNPLLIKEREKFNLLLYKSACPVGRKKVYLFYPLLIKKREKFNLLLYKEKVVPIKSGPDEVDYEMIGVR